MLGAWCPPLSVSFSICIVKVRLLLVHLWSFWVVCESARYGLCYLSYLLDFSLYTVSFVCTLT